MSKARRSRKYAAARHMANFTSNMAEVDRLLAIHGEIAGETPGRKRDVAVLSKSAVVLLVASWEACMEDLAVAAFDILLNEAKDHAVFPGKVRAQASAALRSNKNDLNVWQLADDGWRKVIEDHKESVLERFVGKLNTPRPDQINSMFLSLVGLPSLSDSWQWRSMTPATASQKLNDLVTLRGDIAHRVSTPQAVHKAKVTSYTAFVTRLAVLSHNALRKHLSSRLGFHPWHEYEYA